MTSRFRLFRTFIATALVPLLAVGCKTTETETKEVEAPRVIVSGSAFAIVTNASAQLSATTVGASDAAYTWTSSAPGVASVSATGLVKGLTPGSATITATGTTSELSGSYNVVVANEIPQVTAWAQSGHADAAGEAFRHWDAEGSVPTSCARCHSSSGYRDYLGDDGSAAFAVNAAAAPDTGIGCQACHNAAAQTLSEVRFPSGAKITDAGPEARCMTCHQGREAKDTVEKALTDLGLAADAAVDTVSTLISFRNVHYFAAGATLNGGRVRGGYEYAKDPAGVAKSYDWRFRHVPGKATCVECHDPHSLQVKLSSCDDCHPTATTLAGLKQIREKSSLVVDYDGDGDKAEGIAGEIATLQEKLYAAIVGYVDAKGLEAKICYNAHAHPYFLQDTDADGDCEDESSKYPSWTPRLLKAAYNYQVSKKDPGAFAHNAKYTIQLLFDSIESLSAGIVAAGGTAIDMSAMSRDDVGHFNGSSHAARYASFTGAGCMKCHQASEGLGFFLSFGASKAIPEQNNGLDCATCHASLPASAAAPNLRTASQVVFPSGKTVKADAGTIGRASRLDGPSFVCMTCHQGREAKSTVDAAIAGLDPTTVNTTLGFKNVHYLPAGATLLGKEAAVGYEYSGKTYASRDTHPFGINCNDCHGAYATKHTFDVNDNLGACAMCHSDAAVPTLASAHEIRGSVFGDPADNFDYDGDGDKAEPLADEFEELEQVLLDAIIAKAGATAGADDLCYDGTRHPYFLKDESGNGTCEATETKSYATWTPQLLQAAFNYQLAHKDPGAWAHNAKYVGQLIYDSLDDLNGGAAGDVAGLTRP